MNLAQVAAVLLGKQTVSVLQISHDTTLDDLMVLMNRPVIMSWKYLEDFEGEVVEIEDSSDEPDSPLIVRGLCQGLVSVKDAHRGGFEGAYIGRSGNSDMPITATLSDGHGFAFLFPGDRVYY